MTGKKDRSKTVPYDVGLLADLKNPIFAVSYLNAILQDRDARMKDRFLTALSLVAKAYGVSHLSRQTNLQRETLRKALSERGNPTLSTLLALLEAFGLKLMLQAQEARGTESRDFQTDNEARMRDEVDRLSQIVDRLQASTSGPYRLVTISAAESNTTTERAPGTTVKYLGGNYETKH